MPFEQIPGTDGSVVVTGGNSIELFRLITVKHAIKLEIQGIRVRRGPLVWRRWKQKHEIKGGAKEVLAWVETKITELEKEVRAGREE